LVFVCVFVIVLASTALIALISATYPDFFQPEQGPKPSVSVPRKFAGDWKGTVRDSGGEKSRWSAEFKLRAGKHNGDVRYVGGKCTGIAVPIRLKADRLTVNTSFPPEMSGCDVGDLQITRKGDAITVVYHDDKGKTTASGTLGRES